MFTASVTLTKRGDAFKIKIRWPQTRCCDVASPRVAMTTWLGWPRGRWCEVASPRLAVATLLGWSWNHCCEVAQAGRGYSASLALEPLSPFAR